MAKLRQKEHPVYRRDKSKKKPEKPWLLEYKWVDPTHKARYKHEKIEVWYHGPLKIHYLTPSHALKEINKSLRTGNLRLNDHLYGGRHWRVRDLTSGETARIIISNDKEATLEELL